MDILTIYLRKTASERMLPHEAFGIAKYQKYGYQHGLTITVYIFLDKSCATHKGTRINLDAVSGDY